MDLRAALKDQFHASLTMLAQCVEKCPEDLWMAGEYPRYIWRIFFHAAFFTEVGLYQDEASYAPWPGRPPGLHENMWQDPAYVEPYELPEGAQAFTRQNGLDYLAHLISIVDSCIDGLDLDATYSGYRWYPHMTKISNLLMNLRHVQGHVGQLSELLMARGIDIDWQGGEKNEA